MKIYRLLLLLSSWAHRLTLLNFAILFTCLIGLALVGYAVYLCRKEEKGLKLAACLMLWIGALSFCAFQTHTFPALDTNNVFTGTNQFPDMIISSTPVRDVRAYGGYPSGTLDVWLNAAIAASIAAGGGVIDARGLAATTQTIAHEIDIGDGSHGVSLLLPAAGEWDVTIADGVSCGIKQFNGTSIIGPNTLLGRMIIASASASTSVDSLYCTEPSPSGGGSYVHAEGFQVFDRAGATLATAVMNIRHLFDNSDYERIQVAVGAGSGKTGVQVFDAGYASTLSGITVDMQEHGRGVFLKADATHHNRQLNIIGLSTDHPQSGFPALEISGGTSGNFFDNNGTTIVGLHIEFGAGGGATGVKVQDAQATHIYGATIGNASGGTGYTGIDLSETAGGQLKDFRIDGYQWAAASANTPINNHITGENATSSTAYHDKYLYGGSTAGANGSVAQPTVIVDNEYQWKNASGNILYDLPPGGTPFFVSPFHVGPVPNPNGVIGSFFSQDLGGGIPRVGMDCFGASSTQCEFAFGRGNSGVTSAKWVGYKGDGTSTTVWNIDANGKGTFNGGVGLNNAGITSAGPIAGATSLATTDASFGSGQTNITSACEASFGITTLATGATTTDTTNTCLPATAVIDAVVYRITTTITTAASFTIGDATTAARFCAAQSVLTAGTAGVCFVQADQTGAAGPRQTSAAKVRVTSNVNPSAGAIRLIVYYHTWTAPTS